MNLARFSVNRPVTSGIISLALFVLGIFYVLRMPVGLYPEVTLPFIQVSLEYPGASPEQVEAKLIKPLEAELSGIKKLNRIFAFARPSGGEVVLAFKMSASEREALDNVRERVAVVKGKFPEGAKEPVARRIDVGSVPILIYGIESDRSPDETKKLLDDTLIRAIQRTDGVNEAAIQGLGEERLELQLDAARLSSLRVPPLDVFQELQQKLSVIPWGDVTQDKQKVSVARGVLPDTPAYWGQQVVTLRDGRGIALGEIGNVKNVRDDQAPSVFINGHRGLGLQITKRSDANTVDTAERVRATIAKFELPQGVRLFTVLDQSEYIRENAREVWIALFIGGAFAVLVILLFLTDVKSALISATALPVSVAGSFIFMNMLGFSLNMLSLLALSLAIGLLIDDAVVVRESIYSEMEHGHTGREAAVLGTDKVASAVLATTLAVVAVFLPVGLMTGIVGQFFREFGLTICVSVVLSLWVAFTLDPMLSAYFAGAPRPLQGAMWENWRSFLVTMERRTGELGRWAFKRPALVLGVSLVLLAGSSFLILSRGMDFIAVEDRGQFTINLRAPAGATRERMEAMVNDATERLKGLEGLKQVFAVVGQPHEDDLSILRLVFNAKTQRKLGIIELERITRERLKGVDGAYLVLDPPPIEGIPMDAPVAVFLYGENLDTLRKSTEAFKAKLAQVKGIADVRIETAPFSKNVDVSFRPGEFGYAGTNSQAVEATGRLAITGLEAGSVGPDNTPFYLRLRDADRVLTTGSGGSDLNALVGSLLVPTLKGPTSLSQFVDLKVGERATAIDREKRSRKMVVWATLDRTRSYELVLADVDKLIGEIEKPLFGESSGDKEIFEDMRDSFTIAIVGSLFFIFLILAAQFESLLRPFVIILTLPLAIIGGFLALYVGGFQLALGALIGLILLIGLAAKNGILLVDAIGVNERDMTLEEAVARSVEGRARPILMTSIAMVFGMLPTALMRGGGSEFRSPMAISIIGGVISSTLLSFLVVPAVFGIIGAVRKRRPGTDGSGLVEADEATDERDQASGGGTLGLGGVSRMTKLVPLLIVAGSCGLAAKLVLDRALADAPMKSGDGASVKTGDGASVKPVPNEPVDSGPEAGRMRFSAGHANMNEVVRYLSGLRPGTAESTSIEGARVAAEGATLSSYMAFFGTAQIGITKSWSRPGYTQTVGPIPFPEPIGPQSFSTVIIPRQATEISIGWGLPILNMQALKGLTLARYLREQLAAVEVAKEESATLTATQTYLQFELAAQTSRVNEDYVRIADSRYHSILARKAAGTASKLDEVIALSELQSAKVQFEQAATEARRLREVFNVQTGKQLPEKGLGLPDFPFQERRPFKSTAVEALDAVYKVNDATADVADAALYPSFGIEVGYNYCRYPTSPAAQTQFAVKAQWNPLDSGERVRTVARQRATALDFRAQKESAEATMKSNYATLDTRRSGLLRSLTEARVAQDSAHTAQGQSFDSFKAGLVKLTDVRTSDEAKLKADFAILQLQFGLQSLAVESLSLTGSWLDYLHGRLASSH